MTTDTRTSPPAPAPTPARTDPTRRISLAVGLIYLLTFVASIPQLKLFAAVVDDPAGFVTGSGGVAAVRWGSLLEIITAAAGIGTAVVLYPVSRRVSRTAAIGFVTSRVVEGTLILVGVLCMLTVVTLQHRYAGATGTQAQTLGVTGDALVTVRQWAFLIGPGVMAGVNDLFLGYLLYRSRLVPRAIPVIGLVGAPLILVSDLGVLFGLWGQVSGPGFALGLPVAVFEFSVGVWLTVKGFRPAAVADLDASSRAATA